MKAERAQVEAFPAGGHKRRLVAEFVFLVRLALRYALHLRRVDAVQLVLAGAGLFKKAVRQRQQVKKRLLQKYWRCTPAVFAPFLGTPVSSMMAMALSSA